RIAARTEDQRDGHRQTPARLRLPCADGILPTGRARGDHDRADRDREPPDARRLCRRALAHPGGRPPDAASGAAHAGNQPARRSESGQGADPAVEALTCRLLPYAVADGASNMAADEVLLEAAAAGRASLRFYGWSEATLSLGYFQSEALRHQNEHLRALPFVRRPTGGDALVHHHELTYAVALPAGLPWQDPQEPVTAWLRRIHAIIAATLAGLGIRSVLSPGVDKPLDGILCFQHITPGDPVIGTEKVAGSAQRRQRGALLQHGALLLAQCPYTPALPGIYELSGCRLAPADLCDALCREWVRQTGWVLSPGEWTAAETLRREE